MNIRLLFLFFIGTIILTGCQLQKAATKSKQYYPNEITKSEITFANPKTLNPIDVWQEEIGIPLASIKLGSFIPDKEIELKANVFEPPYRKSLRPLVVLVHGGGFVFGSKDDEDMNILAMELAQRGYVTMSIDYRLMDYLAPSFIKVGYTAVQDTRAAVRYMVNRKEHYLIDNSKVFLLGYSAGACAVLHTGYIQSSENVMNRNDKLDELYGALDGVGESQLHSYDIAGIVSISGAVFDKNILDEKIPTLCFHGDTDKIIPINCGLPIIAFSEPIQKILDVLENWTLGKARKLIKNGKFFNVCGSEQIISMIKTKSPKSKLLRFSGKDHYLFLSRNDTRTLIADTIINETAEFLFELQ